MKMQIYKVSLGKYSFPNSGYRAISEHYATSLMNAYDMANELLGQLLQGCKNNNLAIKMLDSNFNANDYSVIFEVVGKDCAFGVDVEVIDKFDEVLIDYAEEMHFDL